MNRVSEGELVEVVTPSPEQASGPVSAPCGPDAVSAILQMQRGVGNAAVARALGDGRPGLMRRPAASATATGDPPTAIAASDVAGYSERTTENEGVRAGTNGQPITTPTLGAVTTRGWGLGDAASAAPVARHAPRAGGATVVLARRTTPQGVTDTREIGDAAAQAAQEESASEEMTGGRSGTALGIRNVGDISAARYMVGQIQGYTARIQSAGENARVPADALAVNHNAISALNDFLVMAGEQGREVSTFQSAFQTLRGDFARLDAEVNHLRLSGVVGEHSGPNAAGDQAADVVRAATGGSSAASGGNVGGLLERNADMSNTQRDGQAAHDAMQTASAGMQTAQSEARESVHTFQEASNDIVAGLPTRADSDETREAVDHINAARADVEAIKGYISHALDALKAVPVVGSAITALDASPVAQATGVTSTGIANFLVDQVYEDKIASILRSLNGAQAVQAAAGKLVQINALRRAKSNFLQKMTAVNESINEYGRARQRFQQTMQQLGGQMDRASGGGSGYAMLARMLTDTDVFVTQCDTTLRMAQAEQTQAEDTRQSMTKLTGLRSTDASSPQGARERTQEGATPYYEPYNWFSLHQGQHVRADRREMRLFSASDNTTHGSTEGRMGVNPVINRAVEEITTWRAQGQQMRGEFSRAMGMNMSDAAPQRVGGPG